MTRLIFALPAAIYALSLLASGVPAQDGSPKKKLIRAVWGNPQMFGPDKATAIPKMQKALDDCVRAGIDTVIMVVKDGDGSVHFKSDIAAGNPDWNYDFLGTLLEEARKRDITVHAWFGVYNESARLREHPEWLITNRSGEMLGGGANPALPEVRKYERSLMLEVVRKYPVDWIHLDGIHFPCSPVEPYFSYDAETRRLFKEHSGVDPLDIPNKDSGNLLWNEWLEWNRDQVTRLISELRDDLKSVGRPIKISAAVFPDADNARVLIGQDWAQWAERGLVDMLCSMQYTNHNEFFRKSVKRAVASGKGRCLVLAGIGIRTCHNEITPEGLIEQMKISRDLGADGVACFFMADVLKEPFIGRLEAAK